MAQKKGCIPANKQNIFKPCLSCGKETKVTISRLKNRKRVFCDRQCYWKWMKGRTGEKTPNWQGGKCKRSYLDRRKFKRTMRDLVLKRDNNTCQNCGVFNKKMTVDHIQSWAEYVELRFDINNCRTLCMECHYKLSFNKEKLPDNFETWGYNYV